ncbi:MAG: SBBP repeat-containing protein [Candidatus Brocadiaceae bacterium]
MVYIVGYTASSDFPTTATVYDASYNYGDDAFISKLNGGLTSLVESTFLGGSGNDRGNSIAITAGGKVYVTGYTTSLNFPVTAGAYDTSYNGAEVFVSWFNSDLWRLRASTFLGGSYSDVGNAIAINRFGSVYVTGYTQSYDFPVTSGAYDTIHNGHDVFVSKFDGSLKSLKASTLLNGTVGNSIAVDRSGNIYVTGEAREGLPFPTTAGAYDTSYNGGFTDAFVSKFNSKLSRLMASTLLGGSSFDLAMSIAIDKNGDVYIAGHTAYSEIDLPTTSGAYDREFNGMWDAFVSKFNSGLTSLLASTFLGGSGIDGGNSMDIDRSGHIYITGSTESSMPDSPFPTTYAAYDKSHNGKRDVFVTRFDSKLSEFFCDAPKLDAAPEPLEIKNQESKEVTVAVTCKNGTPFVGVIVKATIIMGEEYINVSPGRAVTDVDGKAIFKITAVELGAARIRFESEGRKDDVDVHVGISL